MRARRRRHDRDGGVLVDAVEDEIERLRRRQVGEDRIERRLDAEHRHRGQEEHDVEAEDHVADLRSTSARLLISSAAISVPSSTAPPRTASPMPAPMKEAAEDRRQHEVGRDVGKWHGREHRRKAGDAQHAADGEGAADLPVADGDERAD